MQEGWIRLQCPNCGEQWEADPADLPEPHREFDCKDCEATRPLSEFAKTARDFEIIEEFHAS